VAFHYGPASTADVVAMFLQAGRDLEFVVEDFLAKPMGVAAAGSFLSGGVRLRPSGAGGSCDDDDEEKCASHDIFPCKSGTKNAPGPPTFRGMGPYCDSGLKREINSPNTVSVPCMVKPKSVRVVCTHVSPFAKEYA
jgi:hypothetical protein